MKFLFPLLFSLSAWGQPACINFIDDPSYCRPATRWFITPDTNDYPLYLNGVLQNSPDIGGPASVDYTYAEPKRQIKVGICDNAHGIALDNIITNTATGISLLRASPDAAGITELVSNGCSVVVCSWFTTVEGSPLIDLSNACWQASQSNVILVCSVPNVVQSIDTTPAYPASFNLPLLIPVTSSTRQDTVFNPAAYGTNVIAAPGRVIVTQAPDGTPAYGSGTSYAAPIVAGVCAWMLGQFDQTPAVIVEAIRRGCVPIDSRIVGRVSMQGAVNALRPVVRIYIDGPAGARYSVEQSADLSFRGAVEIATVLSGVPTNAIPEGFYRAKLK